MFKFLLGFDHQLQEAGSVLVWIISWMLGSLTALAIDCRLEARYLGKVY